MSCCSSTLREITLAPSTQPGPPRLFTLPQWNIFMCRGRWLVTPHPSDEGAVPADLRQPDWLGAVKALVWLAAAIAAGILIAGLAG